MIRLVWSGVRFARGRAAALGAGMLVAAVAFSLLTGSVDVGVARIKGVVSGNFRGAYDLLVLPGHSVQTAGHGRRLVQVNYLSATGSGITERQYQHIAKLPGVGIAAPLAVVGYLLETVDLPVTLTPAALGQSGTRVLTVTSSFTADNGLSRYPGQAQGYIYITPDSLRQGFNGSTERLPGGKTARVCVYPAGRAVAQTSPFQTAGGLLLGSCYTRADANSGSLQATIAWSFPVLLAGIDPDAETRLTGLGRSITTGDYLSEGARATPLASTQLTVIPLIGSTESFDGDSDQVRVGLLPPAAVGVVRSGLPVAAISRELEALPATPAMRTTITGAQAWSQLLTNLSPPVSAEQVNSSQTAGQYWTAGQVRYRQTANGELKPVPVTNPVAVWLAGGQISGSQSYVTAPPAAADIAFRALAEHAQASGPISTEDTGPRTPLVHLVGQFDPARLAGFAAGGPGSPLASYRAPLLTGANAASRAALGGKALEPDGNMAGYAQQPPLLLTTVNGASALDASAATSSAGDSRSAAPIGSIRIRVSGLRGTVQEKLAKIAAVGQEIRKATGLQVIVTAGASAQPVTIGLPAGQFGRPALALSEAWTSVGVALVVLRQADRESVALFVLILVVCGLFLAGAALAGVRGRHAEVGALTALGWGRRQVFTLVLGEVAVLGVVAGLSGAALSAGLIAALGLHLPLWRSLLVLPVAAVLALGSGLGPAWLAARSQPRDALASRARAPRRGGMAVRTVAMLAVTGVTRAPGRCVLAAAGTRRRGRWACRPARRADLLRPVGRR